MLFHVDWKKRPENLNIYCKLLLLLYYSDFFVNQPHKKCGVLLSFSSLGYSLCCSLCIYLIRQNRSIKTNTLSNIFEFIKEQIVRMGEPNGWERERERAQELISSRSHKMKRQILKLSLFFRIIRNHSFGALVLGFI